MSLKSIHTTSFNLFNKLIPKTVILIFPSNTTPTQLQNKRFIMTCKTSSIDLDRMKTNQDAYTDEAIEITLLLDDINNTLDTTGVINPPQRNYKKLNPQITYNGMRYSIKSEIYGELETAITLICDRID